MPGMGRVWKGQLFPLLISAIGLSLSPFPHQCFSPKKPQKFDDGLGLGVLLFGIAQKKFGGQKKSNRNFAPEFRSQVTRTVGALGTMLMRSMKPNMDRTPASGDAGGRRGGWGGTPRDHRGRIADGNPGVNSEAKPT